MPLESRSIAVAWLLQFRHAEADQRLTRSGLFDRPRSVSRSAMRTRGKEETSKEETSMVTGRLVGSRYGVTVAAALVSVLFAVALASAQNTFPASGAVGIGTMSPSLSLDVRGQVRIGDANSAQLNLGNGGSFGFMAATSTDWAWV